MATTYKILAMKTTDGDPFNDPLLFYTVPTGKSVVVSSLVVSNSSGGDADITVQLVSADPGITGTGILVTGSLATSTRVAFTEGWTLSAGDYLSVSNGASAVSYTLFGSEID